MSRSEDAGVTIRLMDVAEVQEAFAALGADRDEWRALARELVTSLEVTPLNAMARAALAKLREKEERSG